ncbi:hypothetical protein PUN4_130191 [Paraburkholderia unamae]|nr:hypothetical protein PUN4_130191 [Paraburkholderia unamae]
MRPDALRIAVSPCVRGWLSSVRETRFACDENAQILVALAGKVSNDLRVSSGEHRQMKKGR